MTIKELADTAGCSEKTVRRIIAEKMPGKVQNGKVTRLTWDEAHALMNILPKRNVVGHLGQMSKLPETNVQATSGSSLTEKDLDMISKITAGIVSAIMANLDQRVQKIETKVEARAALLPAPQIKPRDHITKLVREFAQSMGLEYNEVWRELYREFGYRTNTSPAVCARNRGMSTIDYIESEDQIEVLEAVALDFLRPKK